MVWEKGKSGNPDGRSKKAMAIMRQMEGLTFKAVKAYEDALDNGSISEKMSAANAVMDRVYGKAKQQTSVDVTHNTSPHLSALIGLATSAIAHDSAKVIDGQAIEVTRFLDVNMDIED
jgi:hypothetical protein